MKMKPIRQFTGLDYSANMMARAVKSGSNMADKSVRDFLKLANESGTQGAAMTSMLSQANTVGVNSHKNYMLEVVRRALKKPESKAELKKFVKALETNYPKTLSDRVSLASWGAVESGYVKPKSVLSRFFTALNKFMREE